MPTGLVSRTAGIGGQRTPAEGQTQKQCLLRRGAVKVKHCSLPGERGCRTRGPSRILPFVLNEPRLLARPPKLPLPQLSSTPFSHLTNNRII